MGRTRLFAIGKATILAALLIGAGVSLFYLFKDVHAAFGRPWRLALLLLVPPLVWRGYHGLAALGPARRMLAMGLRTLAIAAVILALAELQMVREEESLTLMVLADRSYSIPQELGERTLADVRWNKLNDALRSASKRTGRPNDRLGVISFARQPRLEYPAGQVPELNITNIGAGLNKDFTDVAAAIRMGLASFPEAGARRLLLISDGNENRGDAIAEAKTAQLNGVPIDVVPIRYQYTEEILVDRIDVPSETQPDQDVPLRIVMRNFTDRKVSGKLRITRTVDKDTSPPLEGNWTLDPGLNVVQGKWPAHLARLGGVVVYRAVFIPDQLPSDRADNNIAWAPVIVSTKGRRILVVVQDKSNPSHQALVQALRNSPFAAAGGGLRTIDIWEPADLPSDKDQRRYELVNYDTIILFNIPADLVNHEQQEALRKNVRDQGGGLVMVGGPDSFGAGRWQGEPLEDALPVNTALRSRKVTGKGGLVLIMHASEMPEGNYWQKEIAKLAINKLAPQDEAGILYYDWGSGMGTSGHKWHVPLQEVGPNKSSIIRKLATMQPGDMPEFDPSMRMAQRSLAEAERGLAVRHVILVSDGDHGLLQDRSILDEYKKSRISLTTVGVTTHGPAAQQALAAISQPTGGRHYAVDDPSQLPSIYMKETRVISQNFLFEKPFRPQLTGDASDPLREWTRQFPPLGGFVRTSRKESNLVQVLIRAPVSGDEEYPILAQWQYGLGRVVAFTSDATGQPYGAGREGWAKDWVGRALDLFNDFWARLIEWSLRTVEDTGLALETRYENGKVRVTLIDNRSKEARAQKPLGALRATVAASAAPEAKEVALEPVSSGVYEATIDAEAAGSYAVTVSSGSGTDRPVILGRGAAAVPYSPEFAVEKDNAGLLAQIAAITGGRVIEENDLANSDLFKREGPIARRLQPIWHWLLFAAGFLLLADVAVRRLAIDPNEVGQFWLGVWNRLRGKGRLEAASQLYLDRLKSRKAAAQAIYEQPKATLPNIASRRFEAPAGAPPIEPGPAAPPPPAARPAAPPPPGSAEDFAARLMKAKQKARERIEGEEGK
jgi:uncharacterized membrane protein